jgi:hypothetical protein
MFFTAALYVWRAYNKYAPLLSLNVDDNGRLYMYTKDTGRPIRVRLNKSREFPMGTICCHGLTFSDSGRLSPSHYF